MRVLFLSYTARPNHGSEPGNSWRTAEALANHGHQITLLTQSNNEADISNYLRQAKSDLRIVYCPSVPIKFFWNRGLLGVYVNYLIWNRRVIKMLSKVSIQDYDLVHHFSWGNYWLGSGLRSTKVPLVFGPCGYQGSINLTKKLYGKKWKLEIVRDKLIIYLLTKTPNFRKSISQSSLCISANREAQEKLFQLTGKTSELLMPEISTLRSFPPKNEILARKNLLWVGRFMPRKGVAALLKAFSIVSQQFPDVSLSLIGYGEQSEELRKLTRSLNLHRNVIFLGKVENNEVITQLTKYRSLILPSFRESTGSQILEAASCAVPTVFFDFIGSSTWFNQETSYVVPTGQLKSSNQLIEELANTIKLVLQDDDESYFIKCSNSFQVSVQNSEDQKAKIYSEIYLRALLVDTF
jgi:glycosyltransferase involved in cell wall biosynthesis